MCSSVKKMLSAYYWRGKLFKTNVKKSDYCSNMLGLIHENHDDAYTFY